MNEAPHQTSMQKVTNDLPQLSSMTVTEGTTELLQPARKENEKIFVERKEENITKSFD